MTDLRDISPLPGISPEEYNELRLSVGGTTKARRPLSPVEVGGILVRAKDGGANTKEMTAAMKMTDTTMSGKFIKLVKLDESIQYLVTWGGTDQKALGFSVANQLSRIEPVDHPLFVEKCLMHGITKEEARSVIQLYQRSGQSLQECFARVVARRPRTKILEVILGSISAEISVDIALESMSQLERDELFQRAVTHTYPEVKNFSAKLGKNRFTIIGGKSVGRLISSDELFSEKLNNSLKTLVNTENK